MGSTSSERTPPPKKVKFAATPKTLGTPRTGPGVPESVYRELLKGPPTNPDGPMRDVCAFIEVRVGTEDVSSTFESLMTRLGATVRRHLGPSVTHVVFREGRVSTRKRALQMAIPIVGPLWVEECLAQNRLASPERFPPFVSAAYDCPILSRKIRKPRSWRTKVDSPSPVRRRQRPRLLDLRCEVLLDEAVLSPNTQHLQDIVTKVKTQVLGKVAVPRKCLLSGVSSSFPLVHPSGLMNTREAQETHTPLKELAQVEQGPLPGLPSGKDRRISRRSLEDFSTDVSRARARALSRASWLEGPSVVLTGLEPVDRDAVGAIVKALGGFTTAAEVTDRTTHVICGTVAGKPRRTLHVLFALARGNCWLLPVRWAYQSLESGRWLEEGAFAFSRPRLAVGKERTLLSGCLVADAPLLDGRGPFYIGPATAPPPDRVRDLLLLLGAEVSPSYLRCQVVLGNPQRSQWLSQVTHISERWLLDCISEHQVLPYDSYLLQRPDSSSSH